MAKTQLSKTKRHRTSLLLILLLPCLVSWDTSVDGPLDNQWTSMFLDPNYTEYANGSLSALDETQLAGNEHQELAHWALLNLGWTGLYDRAPFRTIDLNQSVFRPVLRAATPGPDINSAFHYCDDETTYLSERCIPHPAAFAGLPDFSYSVYDWLNKNLECPALPTNAEDLFSCHDYSKWLGAVLNSSHFGDQAEAVFRHFHAIAIALADNARILRALVSDAESSGIYTEEALLLVREAELEALAYEGYAQHFLQDRWASGHMWNRWNGPSYESLSAGYSLDQHRIIGAITGILHGAEAFLRATDIVDKDNTPGPMSSPVVSFFGDTATPISYKNSPDGPLLPAVGDYRFSDMLSGTFGSAYGYTGIPLRVPEQETSMLLCSQSAWADIAIHFYDNGDSTFGVHNLLVNEQTPRFLGATLNTAESPTDTVSCWSQWATNESMSTGISHIGQSSFLSALLAAGATGSMLFKFADGVATSPIAGGEFGKLYYRIRAAAKSSPDGTDLAQGFSLGSLNGIAPGDTFVQAIPTPFHEPLVPEGQVFEGLPDHVSAYAANGDRPGRDKHTIMGFFNKAHASYFCDNSRELLTWNTEMTVFDPMQGLRMPVPRSNTNVPDEKEALARRLDACIYLVDRLYLGTSADYMPVGQQEYTGSSQESHTSGHLASGAAASPTCEIIGALPSFATWDDNPYRLHPGYVAQAIAEDLESGPFGIEQEYDTLNYRSLENWCKALPVIHVNNDDVASDPGTGEILNVTPGFDPTGAMNFSAAFLEPTITMYGFNFGPDEGRLMLQGESGCVDELNTPLDADIVSWSDTEIQFKVNPTRFPPDLYQMTIIRTDFDENLSKIRSVGRALLDVRKTVFTFVGNPGDALLQSETARNFRAVHPYCLGASVVEHEIWDCSQVSPAFIDDCGDPTQLAGTKVFDSGPFTFQPGPYELHQWRVIEAGSCDSLNFPAVQCPTTFPENYGLVYRYERLDSAPISVVPRTFRFTLAWQRPGAPQN